MKMNDKAINVQAAKTERYFSKNYHDFMDSTLLNGEEKIIFLSLKRFLDVKSNHGKIYPTIETLQKMTNWGNRKVIKYINSLVQKGVVKKIRQGLSKPNLYILADEADMWNAKNLEELKKRAEEDEIEKSIRILESNGYTVVKEKEPESLPSPQSNNDPNSKENINNTDKLDIISNPKESQALEKYTMDQMKQLFDYDSMVHDYPHQQQNIDSVISVLHTVMNTTKATIRILKENKPSKAVISKLMKLNKESIMYAIRKYSEQTDSIQNPAAYMLTILYSAPEQYHLASQNQIAHGNAPKKQAANQNPYVNQKPIDIYTSFPQRKYDYELLEKELLSRDIE